MRVKGHLIMGVMIALALSTSAGCGSSGSTTNAKKDTGKSTKTGSNKSAGGCDGTDATIKITKTGETAKLDHAGGVSLSDGAAYTVYVSDSEIDPSKITMTSTPEPAEGQHMANIFLTVFNAKDTPKPITAGTKISFTPDFGVLTFRVMYATADESYNSAAEGKGDVTVTKVGDTVCFSIDYTDDEKTVTGTIEAPIEKL